MPSTGEQRRLLPTIAMIGLVVLFLGLMARFHSPGQGFSSLLMLGDHTITQTVP